MSQAAEQQQASGLERADSGKRRRLSECRKAFSRLSSKRQQKRTTETNLLGRNKRPQTNEQHSIASLESTPLMHQDTKPFPTASQFRDGKKSFKIQLFIRVAPENEPLILATSHYGTSGAGWSGCSKHQSLESLNNSKSDVAGAAKLSLVRQTSSTKRRLQLLAMHNQSCQKKSNNQNNNDNYNNDVHSEDNLTMDDDWQGFPLERERSSTIAGGLTTDEATSSYFERHKRQNHIEKLIQQHSLLIPGQRLGHQSSTGSINNSSNHAHTHTNTNNNNNSTNNNNKSLLRDHIYFKRDGQRFGHEFTLKLAVGNSYRCLFKVKPLVPLDSITIQGHHVDFVDCSRSEHDRSSYYANLSSSAGSLNGVGSSNNQLARNSCQNIGSPSASKRSSRRNLASKLTASHNQQANSTHHHSHKQLPHALTISNVSRVGVVAQPNAFNCSAAANKHPSSLNQRNSLATPLNLNQQLMRHIRDQQQSQLMRYFAHSHSTGSQQLGSSDQHFYMFDWSAGHFEVNKNKVRTQVELVLAFKNNQTLTLPLQVKFYQCESRQHLEWGSQLHFIDYDCSVNNLGDIQLDRVQYY